MNPRRLYRCRHDRQLAGVAAGMAEYLEVDPTVVRILWILSAFIGGVTILLYIILAFVIPLEPEEGAVWTPAAGGGWAPAPGAGTATEPGAEPGTGTATGPGAGTAPAPAWGTAWHHRPVEHRPGRLGLYVGVALVVFGAIAMANVLIPGLAAGGLLGAGMLVALGAALLVASTRPRALDR